MDTIAFVTEDYIDSEFGFQFPTINIYINGKNLIWLVQEVERRDQAPQSYVGLHPVYHRNFRDEFLGRTKRRYSFVLTCTCLEEFCNSIVAKIVIDSKTVVWSEMKSPWLSSLTPSPWISEEEAVRLGWQPIDYSALGRFVFDREQYRDALNAIASSV